MVPAARARAKLRPMQIDAAVPAHVPVAERAPDRDFTPSLPVDRGRAEGRRPARGDRRFGRRARPAASSTRRRSTRSSAWSATTGWSAAAARRRTGPRSWTRQVTLISTRVLAAIEPDPSRWPLAGDQLLVDFDLSHENLPVGDAARGRRGRPGGQPRAAHRLREVQRPVRVGRPQVDQLAAGRALRMRGMNAHGRAAAGRSASATRCGRPERPAAYQESPGRHSQLRRSRSVSGGDAGRRSTITPSSSSGVRTSPSAVRSYVVALPALPARAARRTRARRCRARRGRTRRRCGHRPPPSAACPRRSAGAIGWTATAST